MAELYLGRPLFHYTETDIERLAVLDRVLGPFPASLARDAEAIRPGSFDLEPTVRVRFPRPDVDCKEEVKRVMSVWPLSVRPPVSRSTYIRIRAHELIRLWSSTRSTWTCAGRSWVLTLRLDSIYGPSSSFRSSRPATMISCSQNHGRVGVDYYCESLFRWRAI